MLFLKGTVSRSFYEPTRLGPWMTCFRIWLRVRVLFVSKVWTFDSAVSFGVNFLIPLVLAKQCSPIPFFNYYLFLQKLSEGMQKFRCDSEVSMTQQSLTHSALWMTSWRFLPTRLSPRNRNYERKYLSIGIRGPDKYESWKKEGRNLVAGTFNLWKFAINRLPSTYPYRKVYEYFVYDFPPPCSFPPFAGYNNTLTLFWPHPLPTMYPPYWGEY